MAMKASLIMTGISIGLLALYGADVIVAQAGDGEGFLPFDHMIRGVGIGMPPIILSIMAFFISKNEPSKKLGMMLIITAVLIMVGGIVFLSSIDPSDSEKFERRIMETISMFGIGAFIVVLGAIKIKKSKLS